MNAVLYTHQLEPITVVDVPQWAWQRLAKGDAIRLVVQVQYQPWSDDAGTAMCPPSVTITGERIRRGEHESLMLFTADEGHALRLRADFLPGQRGELQQRERGAFAKGFLDALQRLAP
jgi:hypothetical protein